MAEQDLHDVAFPKIDRQHLAALEKCSKATRKPFRVGQKLFETGDRDGIFFDVKSGEVVDE